MAGPVWTHDQIVEFASMMVHDTKDFQTAEELLDFLVKPWHWDNDYSLWKRYDKPHEGDKRWDDYMAEFENARGL